MQGSHSQGGFPEVSIVNGRVVTTPDTAIPIVWLPVDGQVIAKIPPQEGDRKWLHESVSIRSPHLAKDRWHLPRTCLTRLITAAVDRYGFVVLCRDMARLSRCTRACLEATGADCQCMCLGIHHGQDSESWYERVGETAVADLGEKKRSAVIYSTPSGPGFGDGVIYGGELSGHLYRADRAGRKGWPPASRFMCASCLSTRAQVWDHCHTHEFVRAPLCNTCNTRHWRGWHPEHGRAVPSSNLDTTYYDQCPRYQDPDYFACSA